MANRHLKISVPGLLPCQRSTSSCGGCPPGLGRWGDGDVEHGGHPDEVPDALGLIHQSPEQQLEEAA